MQGTPGRTAVALVLALIATRAPAGESGTTFNHGDWQLACDNTRTCRAAGYQSDDDTAPVSVLITREAGPDQAATAQVLIGTSWDAEGEPSGKEFPLTLRLNGRSHGAVALDDVDRGAGTLSSAQTSALLVALTRDSRIEWTTPDGAVFVLSDRGASAVLLKMDDVQGRVGTRGAVVRRGTRDESRVLPALPRPVLTIAATSDRELSLPPREMARLAKELQAQVDPEVCADAFAEHDEAAGDAFTVTELSHGKRLVSMRCWLAAYNGGSAYWVVNARAPYRPELVTTDGSGYELGQIVAEHKGRGIGDCWSSQSWGWDGRTFVAIGEQTTGLCKGFPGGAWALPTLVTDVR